MTSDYAELPLPLEHLPEDATVDLWVTLKGTPHATLALKNVTSAARYDGWWLIDYTMVGHVRATALLEASTVTLFSVVENLPRQPSVASSNSGPGGAADNTTEDDCEE